MFILHYFSRSEISRLETLSLHLWQGASISFPNFAKRWSTKNWCCLFDQLILLCRCSRASLVIEYFSRNSNTSGVDLQIHSGLKSLCVRGMKTNKKEKGSLDYIAEQLVTLFCVYEYHNPSRTHPSRKTPNPSHAEDLEASPKSELESSR